MNNEAYGTVYINGTGITTGSLLEFQDLVSEQIESYGMMIVLDSHSPEYFDDAGDVSHVFVSMRRKNSNEEVLMEWRPFETMPGLVEFEFNLNDEMEEV